VGADAGDDARTIELLTSANDDLHLTPKLNRTSRNVLDSHPTSFTKTQRHRGKRAWRNNAWASAVCSQSVKWRIEKRKRRPKVEDRDCTMNRRVAAVLIRILLLAASRVVSSVKCDLLVLQSESGALFGTPLTARN
jgi:hypothetical protein